MSVCVCVPSLQASFLNVILSQFSPTACTHVIYFAELKKKTPPFFFFKHCRRTLYSSVILTFFHASATFSFTSQNVYSCIVPPCGNVLVINHKTNVSHPPNYPSVNIDLNGFHVHITSVGFFFIVLSIVFFCSIFNLW